MPVSRITVFLCAFLSLALLSACGNKKNQPRLAPFQEPVQPLPYPKDQGVNELERLWKASIDVDKDTTYSRLKPSINGNQVLAVSSKGVITSYDIKSGKRLWRNKLDAPVYAGVEITNGLGTVALENGEIVLFNADNGQVIWKQASGRQVAAIPAISDEHIIVRTADGLLLGLDVKTGDFRWQQQLKTSPIGIHGTPAPVVVNNVVLVGMAQGVLSAIRSIDGGIFWAGQLGGGNNNDGQLTGIYAPPLVAGNIVIASNFGQQLAAFRLQSGEQLWQLPISTYQPMHLNEEFLFITDELGAVAAINAISSQLIWQQGAFKGRGLSYPAIVGNRVIVGDNQGKVHLLDLVTGGLKQTLDVAKGPVRHIIVNEQRILLFTAHGELLMYQWQKQNESKVGVKEVDLQEVPAFRSWQSQE